MLTRSKFDDDHRDVVRTMEEIIARLIAGRRAATTRSREEIILLWDKKSERIEEMEKR
jgi:hypothetical protein